ncbi:hypothetical protein IE81DRAFT_326539 [Ceraceosorus guamensis]|uniref:Secreted protein n=1 Tax=Ceraceosorus guamensis TaxID=1522189 RepID=A0A316VQV9_9BASI|nr:hypothetical protein IE81DRAFT_326539 [Ceraceosorus guamensis]PWN39438.1 hypothetical protein IE81DRAFT_326539 [Ceraceosorus guamensis]
MTFLMVFAVTLSCLACLPALHMLADQGPSMLDAECSCSLPSRPITQCEWSSCSPRRGLLIRGHSFRRRAA